MAQEPEERRGSSAEADSAEVSLSNVPAPDE